MISERELWLISESLLHSLNSVRFLTACGTGEQTPPIQDPRVQAQLTQLLSQLVTQRGLGPTVPVLTQILGAAVGAPPPQAACPPMAEAERRRRAPAQPPVTGSTSNGGRRQRASRQPNARDQEYHRLFNLLIELENEGQFELLEAEGKFVEDMATHEYSFSDSQADWASRIVDKYAGHLAGM